MKEGLRRIVKAMSFVAWASILIGIATGSVVLFGSRPGTAIVPVSVGTILFAILQLIAWIIAGFSGNQPGDDGLIRPFSYWKNRANTKKSVALTPVGYVKEKPRNILATVAWVLSLSVGIIFANYLRDQPDPLRDQAKKLFTKEEHQRQFYEAMKPVFSSKSFQETIKNNPSNDAYTVGMQYVQRGIKRLPDDLLYKRAEVFMMILNKADEGLCARLAVGTSSKEDGQRVMSILNTLPTQAVSNWIHVTAAAANSEMKGYPDPIYVTDAEAQQAFSIITDGYNITQIDDLIEFAQNPSGVSGSKACRTTKDLYRASLAVPADNRGLLMRVLVSD